MNQPFPTIHEIKSGVSTMDIVEQANDGAHADFTVTLHDNDLAETVSVGVVYDFAADTIYVIPQGVRVKHVNFIVDSEEIFADIREDALSTRDLRQDELAIQIKRDRFLIDKARREADRKKPN